MKNIFARLFNKFRNKKLFFMFDEEIKNDNSVTKTVVYTFIGIILGLLAKGI
jgi:hypothetical protein